MSPTADKLTNKSAVFNEWIAKYPELKNYTQQGLPRTLLADDLLGFTAPNAAWLEATKPPRARSRQIGTDQGMRTLSPEPAQNPSTYTVQFDAASGNADKANLVRALQKGQKGEPSATNSISLFVVWLQEGVTSAARQTETAPWKCASGEF
jgi:hypothetical protein